MFSFIQEQFLFYLSAGIVLFLPGYVFLLTVFGKKKIFGNIEKLIISFAGSIILIDFLMLLLGKTGISFTRFSILATIGLFTAVCLAIYCFRKKQSEDETQENKSDKFSKNQAVAIIAIVVLTILIKTFYLTDTILPSSTDLGHHMYWSKMISETGKIPDYVQKDIISQDGNFLIGPPKPISDFIIGEHLIFSAISLISGIGYISYFPVIILYLINIFGLLGIFILSLRLFEKSRHTKNIAILSLFLVGPLFAIAPPQSKYTGGGVIGNTIGNLLIPLSLYFYIRAFREKNALFLFVALLFSMGLFYTHHLTALLFLMVFALTVVFSLLNNFKDIKNLVVSWLKMIFSAPVISFLVFAGLFALFVYTPTYLQNQAVSTVISEAVKQEHQGLTLTQFKFTVGEPRFTIGMIGLVALGAFFWQQRKKRIEYYFIILSAWIIPIALIALKPDLVGVSIPSARIANYGVYPLSILAAFGFMHVFSRLKNDGGLFIKKSLLFPALILVSTFVIFSGSYDNAQNAKKTADPQKVVETFHASQYASARKDQFQQILHDHIYLTADSWIKLFFMRDYNFPIYRANLDRYENGIDRKETCTLSMISNPDSPESIKCFENLKINGIIVNKKIDEPQFRKTENFWQIYSSEDVNIYYRPQL